MKKSKKETYKLLGVRINALTIKELNRAIETVIQENEKKIIANHNLHSVYLLKKNPDLKAFWNKAFLVHIDGVPLVWWGKILGYPLSLKQRITYIDWVHPLLKTADKNHWKIFYVGSKPGIADKAVQILNKKYKHIVFKTSHGYFNTKITSDENRELLAQINAFNPHILMAGMGMPRQEKWILENFESINTNIFLNCGACFDYIAGKQKTPPRALSTFGLEWFYRFLRDPERLFTRYFREPLELVPLFVNDFKERYLLKE